MNQPKKPSAPPDISIVLAPHAKTDRYGFSIGGPTGHFRRFGCGYLPSATSHSLCVYGAVSALKCITDRLQERYLMAIKDYTPRVLNVEIGTIYNELVYALNGRTTRNAQHKAADHLVAELLKESKRFNITWRQANKQETSEPFQWMNRQLWMGQREDGWKNPDVLIGLQNAL